MMIRQTIILSLKECTLYLFINKFLSLFQYYQKVKYSLVNVFISFKSFLLVNKYYNLW